MSNKHIKKISENRKATAPYNFVPLQTGVVSAPGSAYQEQSSPSPELKSGRIDLVITTLTPLFIRTSDDSSDNSRFFSPAGELRIPGSSIRGMVRNLVEITSWGYFGPHDDVRLYYRSFGKSNLNQEYMKSMREDTEVRAGYLVKDGMRYSIRPASGEEFEKIKSGKVKSTLNASGFQRDEMNIYPYKSGYVIISGPMNGKKNDYYIHPPVENENREIRLSDDDIEAYKLDVNREGLDLFRYWKKYQSRFPDGIPCFFVQQGDGRISFGYNRYFRLGYKQSIGDKIPGRLKKDETDPPDIAHALFGEIRDEGQSYASRLSFEDALVHKAVSPDNPLMGKKVPRTLLGPNPTSFQHYLEQQSENVKNLSHYDTEETVIRGNKMYWHRQPEFKADQDFQENVDTRIQPVKKGVTFTGSLYFDNLHPVELGALLFVLQLPKGLAHKLGQGKPIGLGSVQIDASITLTDKAARYAALFGDHGWQTAEHHCTAEECQQFREQFESYILEQMPEQDRQGSASLFETPRLQELQALLSLDNLERDQKQTGYMELEDFKNRKVLPRASRI